MHSNISIYNISILYIYRYIKNYKCIQLSYINMYIYKQFNVIFKNNDPICNQNLT